MKKLALIPAVFLLASAMAHAAESISVDLDGDNQPDSVRLVSTSQLYYKIEVTLSASGRTVVMEKLARDFSVKDPEETECGNLGATRLVPGIAQNFIVSTRTGDMSACGSKGLRSITLSLDGPNFMIDEIKTNVWIKSIGDSGVESLEIMDFAHGTISLQLSSPEDPQKPRIAKEKLPAKCAVSEPEFESSGVPFCAAKVGYYLRRENEQNRPEGEVCPFLSGQYECVDSSSKNEAGTFYSIYRMVDAINHYDISDQRKEFVSDGKRKLAQKNPGPIFHTAYCGRDWLGFREERFLTLPDGEKNKELFDRLPFQKSETTWAQQDFTGDHFIKTTVEKVLGTDGKYQRSYLQILDCKRVTKD